MGWYSDRYYSRDGDQLCSNTAVAFAFMAFCVGLVPQTTCSFLSVNPAEVLRYPDVWPPQIVVDRFPNHTRVELIEMILNGTIPVGGEAVATGVRTAEADAPVPKRTRRGLLRPLLLAAGESDSDSDSDHNYEYFYPEADDGDGHVVNNNSDNDDNDNPFADRISFAPTYIGQDLNWQHRHGHCPRLPYDHHDPRRLQLADDVATVVEDVVGGGGDDETQALPPIPGLPSFGGISPSDSILDQVGLGGRNITATNFTVNAGPWKVGVYQIDGRCYPMNEAGDDDVQTKPPPEPSLRAARAMGIVASVSGFVGIVLAMTNCHMDDKTRRRRNRYVASLYLLAAVSTWLTFLIHNITACQGKQRIWDRGPLEGLVLLYGKCQCRAGCFLTIVAGCCYLVAVVTVLIYSG